MPTAGGKCGGSFDPGLPLASDAGVGDGRTAGLELEGAGSEEARCTDV